MSSHPRNNQTVASDEPLALTIRQFCKRFNVGRSTLYQYIKAGRIRSVSVCGRTLISMKEADRLLSGKAA